jgi:hypothetical protein
MTDRPYYNSVWTDFDQKKRLILISGPRQTGKTTFAKTLARAEKASVYYNYDIPGEKRKIIENPAFFENIDRAPGVTPLVILDEIHKYKEWKNYLKGVFDGYGDSFRFLVTGSGRLDLYQRKGDSLAGRYWQFHMFPFTIGEIGSASPRDPGFAEKLMEPPDPVSASSIWETLKICSGFPEPFMQGNDKTYRRWAQSYHRQVLRDDIRDAMNIKQVDAMETLYEMVAPRVGSGFSAAACAEQLRVSHATVVSWIEVFKKFYLLFSIKPYHRRISRALLKEPKLYLYDFVQVREPAARFENMAALELLRAVRLWTDYGYGTFELHYLRTKEKREVDFLITRDANPLLLIEAKLSETEISPNLIYFQNLLNVPAVQLVDRPGIARIIKNDKEKVLVVSADRWLFGLG